MTLTNLEKAENEKLLIDNRLTLAEGVIAAHDTVQLDETDCDIHLQTMQKINDQLSEAHLKIINSKPVDITPYVASFHALQNRIFKAISQLGKIKKSFVQPQSSSSSFSSGSQPHSIKLPKLVLPKFHGNYEDWQSFQDLFTNTVKNNTSISNAEKLSYLRSCVEGEAAQLIKSFSITDQHFTEAWDLLDKRYNNKKEIIQSLVRRLINQQSVKTENAAHLQSLQNTTNECLRSLRVLGRSVDNWDDLIVIIIADKLDADTRAEWAKSHRGTDPPSYTQLDIFLTDHIRSLLARGISSGKLSSQKGNSSSKQVNSHVSTQQQCIVCSQNHPIYYCEKFKNMTVTDRNAMVKSKSLCYNCLKSGHNVRECKSKFKCRHCSKLHNTLLHHDQQSAENKSGGAEANKSALSATSGVATPSSSSGFNTHVLLKTIKLIVSDSCGNNHVVRTVLDECSQVSYMTETCATALGLKRQGTSVSVNGISGSTVATLKHSVTFLAKSRINKEVVPVQALVMTKITRDLERVSCNSNNWNHINDLVLADPDFTEPGRIDILLGAEVAAVVLREGLRLGIPNVSPTAQNTIFGWVLFGGVQSSPLFHVSSHVSCSIETTLRKFWEVEELPKQKHLTEEETKCENHFTSTYSRDDSGRYICRLPFNSKKEELGESKTQALVRFHQLERRFRRQPTVKQEYIKFMNEYLHLNHMQLVPAEEENSSSSYYLPHHCVVREDSTTTKLRVVFDGSAKTSTGVSLNDTLMVGPVVQDDLFTILLRFREKPIALKADIAKMYRQFTLPKEDADYLRILWRESEKEPVKTYRLTTVTYGTASAPYQATRCLVQLAVDEGSKFPQAAEALKNNTYVDDLLTSANSKEEAIDLFNQLNSITEKAGMCMRKWATNHPEVLSSIDPELRETECIDFETDTTIKALGIKWNPANDMFQFKVNTYPPSNVTKRKVLSELAKVFDPMGWLSPVTINAKIIFQELWKCKLDWDQSPSINIISMWNDYQSSLSSLEDIRVPRCIIFPHYTSVQLHCFSDSSSKAMAGCVYLRVQLADGTVKVNLVAAKTRVAPIQQQSIPRLELCGAELVCDLVEGVKTSMNLPCELFGWTDSTIVLFWLASFPGRWKTFIANRVSKIQTIIPHEKWNHVISEENPADFPSRGILASELQNNSLWWNGPSWLCEPSFLFPSSPPPPPTHNTADFEEKKTTTLITAQHSMDFLFCRYSSLIRLQRIAAYMLRYIHILSSKTKVTGELTSDELQSSLCTLVKCVQQQFFESEIHDLLTGKQIKHGRLSQLNPFIDSVGILRVGGRLHHSKEKEDIKHPILLPHNHPLTTLIIRRCHLKNLHSGLRLTLSSLQQQYWILRARDATRQIIRKCITCRKQRAELSHQLMGSLPSPRVNPSKPFTECGLDYAGAFNVKTKTGRGQKTEKCYFCIFVCLSTKAIHLECVDSLSTADFIACFKRFCARRGIPSTLYSDCGTTFVGADNELKELLKSAQHQNNMEKELADAGTRWIFNPPSAPHQGGLWEAGVKAVKYHIRRVLGAATPTKKEFETLLCLVEGCVNSRPLCALSSDPADTNALTPGHFIIGGPLNAVPEPDLTSIKMNRLSRWQHTQQMFQHFWRRWRGEYLTSLQQRFKWKAKRDNLQKDDLVIVKDDNLPPMKWKLARVVATHPGHDGLVRVVTVKTATNEIQRPIHKLCPILSCNDDY